MKILDTKIIFFKIMSTEYSIDNTMTQETFNAFQNGYKQAKQEDSKKFILIIFLILFLASVFNLSILVLFLFYFTTLIF